MDYLDGRTPGAASSASSPGSAGMGIDDPDDEVNDMQQNWAMLVGQPPTQVERVAPRDALARSAITKALAGILHKREDTSPMAIGLFGQWGNGKSSQIQFLKDELKRRRADEPAVRMVEFNAWEHEKCDNLSAALAQTVVEHLIKDTSLSEQWELARKLMARRRRHVIDAAKKDWRAFAYRVAPFLSPELAMAALFALLILMTNMPAILKVAGAVLSAAIGAWKTFEKFISANLADWFKRIASDARGGPFGLPDYATKLGSFHDIRETLGHLVALRVKGGDDAREGEYLLIVVDDLDRCNVDTIKLVLDAVRLVTSMPRVVTLVAVDDRIMFAAVESFYAQFERDGRGPSAVAREFLAKVFNISISLPPVSRDEASEFIAKHLFADVRTMPPNDERTPDGDGDSGNTPAPADLPHGTALMTAVEIEKFTEHAMAIGMSNPRALWRMKQAWYLLRNMVLSFGESRASFGPWMRSMFVREAVLALPPDARRAIAQWADTASDTTTISSLPAIVPPALAGLILEDLDGAKSRWAYVDIVLLPAAG